MKANHPIHHHDQTVAINFSADRSSLVVTGSINFKNVVKLRREGKHLLMQIAHSAVSIDLRGIQDSDNSGLVLLTAWVEDAKLLKKKVTFHNAPAFLLRMAQVFGLQSILF